MMSGRSSDHKAIGGAAESKPAVIIVFLLCQRYILTGFSKAAMK